MLVSSDAPCARYLYAVHRYWRLIQQHEVISPSKWDCLKNSSLHFQLTGGNIFPSLRRHHSHTRIQKYINDFRLRIDKYNFCM